MRMRVLEGCTVRLEEVLALEEGGGCRRDSERTQTRKRMRTEKDSIAVDGDGVLSAAQHRRGRKKRRSPGSGAQGLSRHYGPLDGRSDAASCAWKLERKLRIYTRISTHPSAKTLNREGSERAPEQNMVRRAARRIGAATDASPWLQASSLILKLESEVLVLDSRGPPAQYSYAYSCGRGSWIPLLVARNWLKEEKLNERKPSPSQHIAVMLIASEHPI
ncbi:hypothetical protein DFH09DRAFT_1273126 [Mycena vulgaris]|nr:hypothetical protein DFH09DRAFT_1273126 [Mycena vulgaris]